MKKHIRTIKIIAIALFLVTSSFFLGRFFASAANCADEGLLDISAANTTLIAGSASTIDAIYKWRSGIDSSCYNYDVVIEFRLKKPSGSGSDIIGRQPLGRLGLGDSKSAEQVLTYEKAMLTAEGSSTVQVFAQAIIDPTIGNLTFARSSQTITYTLISSNSTYACIAQDGKYACSPDGMQSGCERNFSCQPAGNPKDGTCKQVAKNQCGQLASTTGTPSGNTGSSNSGSPVNFNFSIQSPNSYQNFTELLDAIAGWLIKIAIPLATIMILYAGVRFLFARGNPGEVTMARQILVYAIVGLAIVLIGSGFISLINSILGVDNGGSSSTQQNTGSSNQLPTSQ